MALFLVSVAASSIGDNDDNNEKISERFMNDALNVAKKNHEETIGKIAQTRKERQEAIDLLDSKISSTLSESEINSLKAKRTNFQRLGDPYTYDLAHLWEQQKIHERSIEYWNKQLQNLSLSRSSD